jgi:hypothetical protein
MKRPGFPRAPEARPARSPHTRCQDGQPLSFSASSVSRHSARFRLQIEMIPRCEQSLCNPTRFAAIPPLRTRIRTATSRRPLQLQTTPIPISGTYRTTGSGRRWPVTPSGPSAPVRRAEGPRTTRLLASCRSLHVVAAVAGARGTRGCCRGHHPRLRTPLVPP